MGYVRGWLIIALTMYPLQNSGGRPAARAARPARGGPIVPLLLVPSIASQGLHRQTFGRPR